VCDGVVKHIGNALHALCPISNSNKFADPGIIYSPNYEVILHSEALI
jgi:hypothetical protein